MLSHRRRIKKAGASSSVLLPFALFILLIFVLVVVDADSGGGGARRIVEVYHPFPFTPDGLIRQLQHAQQAVQRGSLSLALAARDGVVLVGERRQTSPLLAPGPSPKIGRLAQHLAYVMSGIVPDGRYLVKKGRFLAQKHWFEYGEDIGLPALLLDLSKVATSAHFRALPPAADSNGNNHKEKRNSGGRGGGGGGSSSVSFEEIRSQPSVDPIGDAEMESRKEGLPARHFGVGFLFAGPERACESPSPSPVAEAADQEAQQEKEEDDDDGQEVNVPSAAAAPTWVIYEMGPSGMFLRWDARAIGEGSDKAEGLLETLYRPDRSLEECKQLAIRICDSALTSFSSGRQGKGEEGENNVEMACLTRDAQGRPVLVRIGQEEIDRLRAHVSETVGLVDPSSP